MILSAMRQQQTEECRRTEEILAQMRQGEQERRLLEERDILMLPIYKRAHAMAQLHSQWRERDQRITEEEIAHENRLQQARFIPEKVMKAMKARANNGDL